MLSCTIIREDIPAQLPDHLFVDIFKHRIIYQTLALLGPKGRAEQLQKRQLASGFNALGGTSQPIAPNASNFGPLEIYMVNDWLEVAAGAVTLALWLCRAVPD